MKRFILLSATLIIALSVVGQQARQEVIASAGGNNSNGGLSISWTLGEAIVPTFKSQDGQLMLTHGFQQKLILTAVEEILEAVVEVIVYPNPVSDIVNIQFESPVEREMILFIMDNQGRFVKNDVIEVSAVSRQFNLKDLPAGIYYLKLSKGKLSNVYKVVKL